MYLRFKLFQQPSNLLAELVALIAWEGELAGYIVAQLFVR